MSHEYRRRLAAKQTPRSVSPIRTVGTIRPVKERRQIVRSVPTAFDLPRFVQQLLDLPKEIGVKHLESLSQTDPENHSQVVAELQKQGVDLVPPGELEGDGFNLTEMLQNVQVPGAPEPTAADVDPSLDTVMQDDDTEAREVAEYCASLTEEEYDRELNALEKSNPELYARVVECIKAMNPQSEQTEG